MKKETKTRCDENNRSKTRHSREINTLKMSKIIITVFFRAS